MIFYLVFGITLGFAAAVQPGPYQTFTISRTLDNGWRSTLPVAFAPLLSDIPVIILALLVLSAIPAWMEWVLHIAGGLFVLFLAYGAYRSFKSYNFNNSIQPRSGRQNFFKATFVNLLNPNPYLEWSLVMGPLFLKGWRESPDHGVALLSGFYGTMVLCMIGIIILFSTIRRLGPKVNRIFVGISAIALAGFGIYQLYMGILDLISL